MSGLTGLRMMLSGAIRIRGELRAAEGSFGCQLAPSAPPESAMNHRLKLLSWPLAGWIAYIFLWYLQYKFTGHPGSVDLFTTLTDWLGFHGHEKVMRIGTGSAELAASALLFLPRTQLLGAAMALGIMTVAIFFHLVSPLGIDPYADGGVLFKEACATWIAAAGILVLHRAAMSAIVAELHRRLWPAA